MQLLITDREQAFPAISRRNLSKGTHRRPCSGYGDLYVTGIFEDGHRSILAVDSDIRAIFTAPSMEEAKRLLDIATQKYAKTQPKLSAWMEENIPEGLTVFAFPESMRKKLRSNNIEERLNRSIKARTRLISVFPNQASQIRLVSAICMEISDDWETGKIYLNVKDV